MFSFVSQKILTSVEINFIFNKILKISEIYFSVCRINYRRFKYFFKKELRMNVRKDGQENWMVESGLFVICPLEHLSEMLQLPEDFICEKLGNIHGIVSMQPWTKVSVEKIYGITDDAAIYNQIEIKSVKTTMSDTSIEIVRHMDEDELTLDEYVRSQKNRFENLEDFKDKIKVFTEISKEHTEIIKDRTDNKKCQN